MRSRIGNSNELTRREILSMTASGVALVGLSSWPGIVHAAKQRGTPEQVIHLLPGQRLGTINKGLFSYLVEPQGRNVEGIWVGEESSIPNQEGFRLDTLRAFRRLGPTVARFPGGTFAESYHWQDGIGPRAQRPRTFNYFWGGEEDNHFGTDEFLRYCELVGSEAWIKVNLVTAGLGDTLKWMQYCNYEGNTYWANLRRQNGHARPYGVKYWTTTNSATDAFSPEYYAELVNQWTFFMRQADQQSKIVIRGSDQTWNERFLARYATLRKSGDTSQEPLFHLLALYYPHNEEPIKRAAALLDLYLGANKADLVVEEWRSGGSFPSGGEPFLPLPPDWKFSYPMEYLDPRHFESHVRMKQALSTARKLHMFLRNADRVKLATFISPHNTKGALIRTDGPRFHLTPNYHVFHLLKGHKGAELIGVEFDRAGDLDVVASVNKEGQKTTVSIVNRKESESVEARLRIKDAEGRVPSKATAAVLTGKPTDENTFETPDKVKPGPGKVEGKQDEWVALCPPYSLTVVTLTS